MTIVIGYCGYSYHEQGFYTQNKSGFPAYLIRLQTEGTCIAVARGERIEIKKGDLLLIKPGDDYELLISEKQHSGDYHVVCEGIWVDQWWNRTNRPTVSRIELDEKLIRLWQHLIVEERRPESEKNRELSGFLLRAIFLTLERSINETAITHKRPYSVSRMMRYIEEHATSTFQVEEVAKHAGLSLSRAVHLFKNSVGQTMVEYALEIRLSAAIERMKYTTMTLEQIALDCGFGSYGYFHKVFKKKYNVSPGAYRRLEFL